MDITFTGMFSGFRVANFLYSPIGMKHPVHAKKTAMNPVNNEDKYHEN